MDLPHETKRDFAACEPAPLDTRESPRKRIQVFWFFFSKKNKRFFLKKEAKTFVHGCADAIASAGAPPLAWRDKRIGKARQIRGTAINQLPKVDTSIVIGGPMVTPVSSLILGSEAAL